MVKITVRIEGYCAKQIGIPGNINKYRTVKPGGAVTDVHVVGVVRGMVSLLNAEDRVPADVAPFVGPDDVGHVRRQDIPVPKMVKLTSKAVWITNFAVIKLALGFLAIFWCMISSAQWVFQWTH